jgi:hypothetical protein
MIFFRRVFVFILRQYAFARTSDLHQFVQKMPFLFLKCEPSWKIKCPALIQHAVELAWPLPKNNAGGSNEQW